MNTPIIKVMTYVLDDQEIVLKGIEHAFNSTGIKNYQLFTNDVEFLDAAGEDVHIAVIDYWLQHSDRTGLEVCKLLLEKNPRCYVIIMSGQSDMDVVIDFMNSGAWKYVRKYANNYILKILEYVQEAGKRIAQDLAFYSTLLEKHNALNDANTPIANSSGHTGTNNQ